MMRSSENEYAEEFPLHWHVWHNELDELKRNLEHDHSVTRLEKRDPRDRTPLMLAVTLGAFECAKLLLLYKADANVESKCGWTLTHEATATGDPEMLTLILHHRNYQRTMRTATALRRLLQQLQESPDFYAEIQWKFSSWVPFVSQMCPSDTYKVYKRGASVRIDTTLAGFSAEAFDGASGAQAPRSANDYWVRGNLSYRFTFKTQQSNDDADGSTATNTTSSPTNRSTIPEVLVIDHDKQCVIQVEDLLDGERVQSAETDHMLGAGVFGPVFDECAPFPGEISKRLTSPICTTYVDVARIDFERAKAAGLLSWFAAGGQNDKIQNVNGHDCKVYMASNVDLVTKTRTEHLTEQDKRLTKEDMESRSSFPMAGNLMDMVFGKQTVAEPPKVMHDDCVSSTNPFGIKAEEYFNPYVDLQQRDIGRPREVSRRANSFKATLYLCDDFPLDLREQIVPIIDLMASSNAHFARLKNFIELQLPAGFPIRIEIPLFHVFTAEITFGNVFAAVTPVQGVSLVNESSTSAVNSNNTLDFNEQDKPAQLCVIDESVFDVPDHYERVGAMDNMVNGQRGARPAAYRTRGGWGAYDAEEDVMLQLAIQESLVQVATHDNATDVTSPTDEQRNMADSLIRAYHNQQQQPTTAGSNSVSSYEAQLQRAIEESLRDVQGASDGNEVARSEMPPIRTANGHELLDVIEQSRREHEAQQTRQQKEDEELRLVLELSKTEM